MAEATAIRTMLERIGFTQEAATEITGDQGINSVDELRILDDEQSENLCKVLRRPGGESGGNPNRGVQVSAKAEEALKLAIYYVKHQDRVSRAVDVGQMTLVSIRKLVKQRDTEKNHSDPDIPPKIDAKDWPKTMEGLRNTSVNLLGLTVHHYRMWYAATCCP